MNFLRVRTAQEWNKSPEEFEALSADDQAYMMAFVRANMKMRAWEADEQEREWERSGKR